MALTFGRFQCESGFFDPSQDCPDLPPVVFQALREDEDVVQICHTEYVEIFTRDLVRPSLEGCWFVGQPEGHDTVFV